jgi:hypothetical protein
VSVRITWKRVNELQGKIAQRFAISYDLKKVADAGYACHWTLGTNGATLPEKFLSPREVFTYLSGIETGLEQTASAVSDEVLRHMDEAEDYDFEDALMQTEKIVEYFEEHAGTIPVPVLELAMTTITSIAKTVNKDIKQRIKGSYSHNIISLSLLAMYGKLVADHKFSEEGARRLTNLILEGAPIISILYSINPE